MTAPMHAMTDERWLGFFRACADTLEVKPAPLSAPVEDGSWCSWTTFSRLTDAVGYWSGPLPTAAELRDTYLGHGQNWSQYFTYTQVCHVIVPRVFVWERAVPGQFEQGKTLQDIDAVAETLRALDIPHRLTSLVLEVKCY